MNPRRVIEALQAISSQDVQKAKRSAAVYGVCVFPAISTVNEFFLVLKQYLAKVTDDARAKMVAIQQSRHPDRVIKKEELNPGMDELLPELISQCAKFPITDYSSILNQIDQLVNDLPPEALMGEEGFVLTTFCTALAFLRQEKQQEKQQVKQKEIEKACQEYEKYLISKIRKLIMESTFVWHNFKTTEMGHISAWGYANKPIEEIVHYASNENITFRSTMASIANAHPHFTQYIEKYQAVRAIKEAAKENLEVCQEKLNKNKDIILKNLDSAGRKFLHILACVGLGITLVGLPVAVGLWKKKWSKDVRGDQLVHQTRFGA